MDVASAALIGVIGVAAAAGTNGEFKFNAGVSVFPPINGPITLPAEAIGFYTASGEEFLRPLSAREQQIWSSLDPVQRQRAAAFIRNGGTLVSSLGSDF